MELFNNLVLGFSVALSMQNLWFCFIGVLLGGTCASKTVDIAPSRDTCEPLRTRPHPRLAAHQASPPTA